jgi:tetrahydrodipicolinate N-succinyltransferase
MVNVKGGGDSPVSIGQAVKIGFREIEGVVLPEAEMQA